MQSQLQDRQDLECVLVASTARPEHKVLALHQAWEALSACDFVLNASSNDVALELGAKLGTHQVLIDNSSAYRMNPDVALVVPELNADVLRSRPRIVANPNCTTILLCLGLAPLRGFGIKRVTVSTYQAASGAGIKGMEELNLQLQALGRGDPLPPPQVFPFVLAGNVLSHNTPIREESVEGAGHNEEEWKVLQETRKILNQPSLPISVTCMRVPVERAHTESVSVDLQRSVSLSELRRAMQSAVGVRVVDDWTNNYFPMPIEAQNQDSVLVGRIRKDPSLENTVHFLLAGDQIRKGAATNAIQIMDRLLSL
jgi:aspartate-semialdehyde dehydrogenase